jgi:CTP synthase (UTP-ammonia lyase)
MSPFEHGEVFVLDDGGEVYERDKVISLCILAHICSCDVISSSVVAGGLGSWEL